MYPTSLISTSFGDILAKIDEFIWGPWLLIPLLLGTGISS